MTRGRRPAFVLGGLELVRALALAGIRSIIVAPEGDPRRFSRHVATAIDPSGRSLLDSLVAFASSHPEPPVLYYEWDDHLTLVSRHRERLGGYRFLLPDAELVEDLVDKARFQRLAERLGLPTPPGHLIRPADSSPADVELPYPLVLKPVPYRDERWASLGFHAKAIDVGDRRGLEELWPKLAEAGVELLAQTAVPGPETDVVSYHVYVDADGSTAGEFTGRKVRTWPARFGVSTALVTSHDPPVLELGRRIVADLGLVGVAKLDFKRDGDGRLHLLEVNPRFTLWVHAGAVAGVNLPALVHADLTGSPRPRTRSARAGVRWVSATPDSLAARDAGISRARWLAWAARAQTSSGFLWSDPGTKVMPLLRRRAVARRSRRRSPAATA